MEPLIIILGIIIVLFIWIKPSFKNTEITSQDGLEDCVKDNKQEYKGEINDHMKSVVLHPSTYAKLNAREGERLHKLALKNKRKQNHSGL